MLCKTLTIEIGPLFGGFCSLSRKRASWKSCEVVDLLYTHRDISFVVRKQSNDEKRHSHFLYSYKTESMREKKKLTFTIYIFPAKVQFFSYN